MALSRLAAFDTHYNHRMLSHLMPLQASQLKHSNGAPLLEIYGNHARPDRQAVNGNMRHSTIDNRATSAAIAGVLHLTPTTPCPCPVVVRSATRQGSTLTFSLLDPSGQYLSWRAAAHAMMEAGLHVRTCCLSCRYAGRGAKVTRSLVELKTSQLAVQAPE